MAEIKDGTVKNQDSQENKKYFFWCRNRVLFRDSFLAWSIFYYILIFIRSTNFNLVLTALCWMLVFGVSWLSIELINNRNIRNVARNNKDLLDA